MVIQWDSRLHNILQASPDVQVNLTSPEGHSDVLESDQTAKSVSTPGDTNLYFELSEMSLMFSLSIAGQELNKSAAAEVLPFVPAALFSNTITSLERRKVENAVHPA